MFCVMSATATPFDSDAPEGCLRPIIRYKPTEPARKEIINAAWGSNPRFRDGVSYRFVRSEGQTFPTNRCLIPASEFHLSVGDKRYRVTLDSGSHFYLAGRWEPPLAGWPLSYRVVTVAANPEVARYQDRHGALLLPRQVMQWLDGTVPEIDRLVTPPAHTFLVEEITSGSGRPFQRTLSL